MVFDWEEFTDRAARTGGHRFFVPGYEDLCDRMREISPGNAATGMFMSREASTCREMRNRRGAIEMEERTGTELRQEREDGGTDFVGSVHYRTWRDNAEHWVEAAGTTLEKDSEYQPFLARDPALKKSLERNIRSLSERLEIDAPAWNEIEERRTRKIMQEMELRKAREKDRGFDIGW